MLEKHDAIKISPSTLRTLLYTEFILSPRATRKTKKHMNKVLRQLHSQTKSKEEKALTDFLLYYQKLSKFILICHIFLKFDNYNKVSRHFPLLTSYLISHCKLTQPVSALMHSRKGSLSKCNNVLQRKRGSQWYLMQMWIALVDLDMPRNITMYFIDTNLTAAVPFRSLQDILRSHSSF